MSNVSVVTQGFVFGGQSFEIKEGDGKEDGVGEEEEEVKETLIGRISGAATSRQRLSIHREAHSPCKRFPKRRTRQCSRLSFILLTERSHKKVCVVTSDQVLKKRSHTARAREGWIRVGVGVTNPESQNSRSVLPVTQTYYFVAY